MNAASFPFETPMIRPHRLGLINKFGRQTMQQNLRTEVFDVPVERLIQRYGSPLFVTSEQRLRDNIRNLISSFRRYYPEVIHGWSYKTNYNPAVCNILHQEGSWAEVVSAHEYERARSLGVPGSRILFNGPAKQAGILQRAIEEGAHLHVDHGDELRLIESLAAAAGKVVALTLRLNLATGYSEPWSRFGFNLESGQAREAAHFIAQSPHLQLTGLHCHIGTYILEPRAYAVQVEKMCAFMDAMEEETKCHIQSLDIGGGLPSCNALQGVYLPPEQSVPDLDRYASLIGETLMRCTAQRLERGRARPCLILESGRAVVDDAQQLITSVLGCKRLADGRRGVVMDAGVNLLFTAYWYNHAVHLGRPVPGPEEDTALLGPLCMNIDVLRQSISLPPVQPGDCLVISPTGAYNNTQWQQFIEYRPAIVLVHSDMQVSVIREREDLASMKDLEICPEHLQSFHLE